MVASIAPESGRAEQARRRRGRERARKIAQAHDNKTTQGPTHVNLAFRENLAPRRGFRRGVGGARNDPDLSVKADWDNSALQGARYATWASHDEPWTRTTSANTIDASRVADVLRSSRPVWKSNVAAHLLPRPNHDLYAIDATPTRRRGGIESSPLDGASTAASSSRNDLVKNYRARPTHWLISTQVVAFSLASPSPVKMEKRPPSTPDFSTVSWSSSSTCA